MQYYKKEDSYIVCLLCKHYCKLKDEKIGVCGVNKNENGELKNLVYGHLAALNLDPIEKKPLYHFLPSSLSLSFGTVGCNFQCPFYQNWHISQNHIVNENEYVSPEKIVDLAINNGAKSISYTYNEPTVFYPYAKDVGVIAKQKGLKNIFVSNGYESNEVIEDMSSWVDAINIDLKCWNEEYYKKHLKGGLKGVIETIKNISKTHIWIETTTLIIEDNNSSSQELENIANFLASVSRDIPWHISAFYPNYKMQDTVSTSIGVLKNAYEIGKKAGLKYIYIGNVPIGSSTKCPKCNEELIKRDGYKLYFNKIENSSCSKCVENIEGVWE
jgi:pyruvate formate lyase activating enzyme